MVNPQSRIGIHRLCRWDPFLIEDRTEEHEQRFSTHSRPPGPIREKPYLPLSRNNPRRGTVHFEIWNNRGSARGIPRTHNFMGLGLPDRRRQAFHSIGILEPDAKPFLTRFRMSKKPTYLINY
jgi:hypothetical protein